MASSHWLQTTENQTIGGKEFEISEIIYFKNKSVQFKIALNLQKWNKAW